jgi:hypothetical protein
LPGVFCICPILWMQHGLTYPETLCQYATKKDPKTNEANLLTSLLDTKRANYYQT